MAACMLPADVGSPWLRETVFKGRGLAAGGCGYRPGESARLGAVELPLRLFGAAWTRSFDLDNPFMRRWLYQTVLREASGPEDLTRYLDRDTLIGLWPQLRLPGVVRKAWEELHPVLCSSAAR